MPAMLMYSVCLCKYVRTYVYTVTPACCCMFAPYRHSKLQRGGRRRSRSKQSLRRRPKQMRGGSKDRCGVFCPARACVCICVYLCVCVSVRERPWTMRFHCMHEMDH